MQGISSPAPSLPRLGRLTAEQSKCWARQANSESPTGYLGIKQAGMLWTFTPHPSLLSVRLGSFVSEIFFFFLYDLILFFSLIKHLQNFEAKANVKALESYLHPCSLSHFPALPPTPPSWPTTFVWLVWVHSFLFEKVSKTFLPLCIVIETILFYLLPFFYLTYHGAHPVSVF